MGQHRFHITKERKDPHFLMGGIPLCKGESKQNSNYKTLRKYVHQK